MLLPTTVVGSWPVPEWLERLKTDYYRGRISRSQLGDVHDMAIKAALKDQELAGVDIVSDGELRRDNDVDYFLARMPGVVLPLSVKEFYFDYHTVTVPAPLPAPDTAVLGLADDYAFTRAHTDRPIKFSFTGPFSLAQRVADHPYADRAELARAIAGVLHREAIALAERGATHLQIDEPFLAGHPQRITDAIEAVNIVVNEVGVRWGLHVCYGNRYARPSWEGHYDFLFPAVLDARVHELVLEFGRKGDEDLPVLAGGGWDRDVGLGVIDVKDAAVELPLTVATRIRRALELVPAHRLAINPDCGLRHLPATVARSKLAAMVEGAAVVRETLTSATTSEPATVAAAS
ncbi:hypothetical protein LQ327_00405 [Actinomycetospora endophytica]|uniref:Cobalamin-independent methionine synthase MetE C-terminal/archaeal domain-containing protein n=1 Tax=Actinomycetospora endophytica TaxID=2291215 RepID=A0ABS8P0T3_9PSEU|nr:hypothetical protein [Actinomycetospora endophytica]MCD2191852.1 hypothetical protein [Actinomycetospora endophytica]